MISIIFDYYYLKSDSFQHQCNIRFSKICNEILLKRLQLFSAVLHEEFFSFIRKSGLR